MKSTLILISAALLSGCCGCPGGTTYPAPEATGILLPDGYYADLLAGERAESEYRAKVLSEEGHKTLMAPESVVLLSLDPDLWRDAGRPEEDSLADNSLSPQAHALEMAKAGRGVMGRLEVPNDLHARTAWELYSSVEFTQEVAECYDPRHALVFRRTGHDVVCVICFECDYVGFLEPDTKDRNLSYLKAGRTSARDFYNYLLDEAGIARDKPPVYEDDEEVEEEWDDEEMEFEEDDDE